MLMCAVVEVNATRYQKVTSVTELADGDVVLMANENAKKVSGACAGKYIEAVDATFTDGVVEIDGATEITLKASGSNWNLKVGTKTIGNNNVDLNSEGKGTTTYSIRFDGGNVIIANTVSTNGTFYFNGSQPRFKTYNSTSQQQIQLYKKVSGTTPSMTLSTSTLSFDKKALVDGTATDSKVLNVWTSDLKAQNLTVAMKQGTVFSVNSNVLAPLGGELTISYTATAEGEYKDTVVVTGWDNDDKAIVRECAMSVVISKEAPTGSSATYKLLQSLDDLKTGDKVFIGTAAKNVVLGVYDYDTSRSNIRAADATYGEGRRTVTANDVNAYVVTKEQSGNCTLTGADGLYLCDYNNGKNLSSTETLDNKARWTITITEGVTTIKNVAASSYQILFNKTANPALFCCYTGIDSNTAAVVLYSNNAPDYQEKEWHPALTMEGNLTTLEWGQQEPDEASADWGDSRKLHLTGVDLQENVSVSVTGEHFSCYTSSLTPTQLKNGVDLTIYWEADKKGTYSGTLTLSSSEIETITISLHAEAVDELPEEKPVITVSTHRVYLNPNWTGDGEVSDSEVSEIFSFSVSNLKKNLYLEWRADGSWPLWQTQTFTLEMENGDFLPFQSKVNMGMEDRTDFYIEARANSAQPIHFETELHLFVYAADKETIAAEETIRIGLNVTQVRTPDPNPDTPSAIDGAVITGMEGVMYNLLGQPVDETYRGIVIIDGQKRIQY